MKGIVSPAAAVGPLKDIQAELEKALAPEIRSRVVDIKTRKEGLVVSLREVGFYESGASTTPSRLSAAGYAEFHPVADND
jgi:flagellar motor protein MotB